MNALSARRVLGERSPGLSDRLRPAGDREPGIRDQDSAELQGHDRSGNRTYCHHTHCICPQRVTTSTDMHCRHVIIIDNRYLLICVIFLVPPVDASSASSASATSSAEEERNVEAAMPEGERLESFLA